MLSVSHAWWHYNLANWVSHLTIDYVMRLGEEHFVGFLLAEAMNLQSFQTVENNNLLVKYYVHQGDNIGITSLACKV